MGTVPLRLFVVVALALAVGLASAASPFASPSPDGLTSVAQQKGFAAAEAPGAFQRNASPAAGYAVPGVKDERLATGLGGFAGTLLLFALGFGLARALRHAAHPGRTA